MGVCLAKKASYRPDVFFAFCQGWKAMPALPVVSEEQQSRHYVEPRCLQQLSLGIKIPEETSTTAIIKNKAVIIKE